MILLFKGEATADQYARAQHELDKLGLSYKLVDTARNGLLIVLDDVSTMPSHIFTALPGVERALRIQPQCSLVYRKGLGSVEIPVAKGVNVAIGGGGLPVVIAGPCSVESREHVMEAAQKVKAAGAKMLRGGAFKPRTSPYDFQGLGIDGLQALKEARERTGLPVVSEVMSVDQVERAEPFVDVFQIGARNMYNYELLKEVGRARKPVLLKRGMSATLQELLSAAEYILLEGNMQVILCERGIRTFETHTRNTLDLSAVAALKNMTPLPVIVDPSHGTGRPELIRPLSRAAIACGADGLMIEVHEQPCTALSDGEQAINSLALREIVTDLHKIHSALSPLDQPSAQVEDALPQPGEAIHAGVGNSR